MFQERDGEKEILLGNKQLLGIFFLLAILLCVFFTAGYMVGRTTGAKKPADPAVEAKSTPVEAANANGGETHAVNPDSAVPSGDQTTAGLSQKTPDAQQRPSASGKESMQSHAVSTEDPLGSRKKPRAEKAELTRSEEEQEPADSEAAPAGHSTYLQVAALSRADAESVAKVLSKKGFHARIAPKPGTQYYRVLVGPVRDAGELNSTRDALKSKGFREVFVQHL